MPAENSLRLDNEERLPPVLKPAGKQDEEAALRASEVRAVEDDELLAQEEVLSHQLGFTASEVSDSTERGAMRDCRAREMAVLTACSPRLTNDWTRFKISNTICLLHAASQTSDESC